MARGNGGGGCGCLLILIVVGFLFMKSPQDFRPADQSWPEENYQAAPPRPVRPRVSDDVAIKERLSILLLFEQQLAELKKSLSSPPASPELEQMVGRLTTAIDVAEKSSEEKLLSKALTSAATAEELVIQIRKKIVELGLSEQLQCIEQKPRQIQLAQIALWSLNNPDKSIRSPDEQTTEQLKSKLQAALDARQKPEIEQLKQLKMAVSDYCNAVAEVNSMLPADISLELGFEAQRQEAKKLKAAKDAQKKN